MRRFMDDQLTELFTRARAASLESQFLFGVQVSTNPQCVRSDPFLVVGPPGPILDRTRVVKVAVTGVTATVTAQVAVTDWQGGVTGRATAGNGRRVGWRVVHGLLDTRYVLDRDSSGRWRVRSSRANFAPGYGP
jgi:hypothetical protein